MTSSKRRPRNSTGRCWLTVLPYLAADVVCNTSRCRPSPYLNNIIEQDHRFIKKRIAASFGFRSAEGAWRTIDGYEAMHVIRKG
jgi:transposase-like protein